MNLRSKKFVPLARHALDITSMRRTQQAVNALLNGKIVVGSNASGIIHYADGNTVFELPAPPTTSAMFPLKVYNINNISATVAQKELYTAAKVNIDDFTYQIRGGQIGLRPYQQFGGSDPILVGNFELISGVLGTDQEPDTTNTINYDFDFPAVANPGPNPIDNSGCVLLSNTEDTLVAAFPINQPGYQILLDPSGGTSTTLASFWALINPPDGEDAVFIYGRMWDPDGSFGRPQTPFDVNPNIIPLAICGFESTDGYPQKPYTFSQQLQWGNLVNRWTPNAVTYRGRWTADNLSGQIFYQGDIVIDDSAVKTAQVTNPPDAGGNGTFTYQNTYVYVGGSNQETTPPSGSGNWLAIASTILT